MSSPNQNRTSQRFGLLEERIGYKFKDHSNLERALTHASARKKSDTNFHYERLEFLGDRVLGLTVAEILYSKFPDANEGELSLRLNALVKGKTLAKISDNLNLHQFIRTGGDLKELTGKRMVSVRADVLEALIASIYLDGGLEAAENFIRQFWSQLLFDDNAARRDSKTALQEWAHAERHGTPVYAELGRVGPDHDPVFTVEVRVGEVEPTEGEGSSKRIAEQNAAEKMLFREGIWQIKGQNS